MKQDRLANLLDTINPDVVFRTETWLDDQIKNTEIFPDGYKVHRKDRVTSNGGGVLIAVKKKYNSEDEPELDADSEIVWAKI